MMSREDMLHELELLPAWQLRDPVPSVTAEAMTDIVAEPAAEAPLTAKEEVPAKNSQEVETAVDVPKHQFRLIASEDAQWLFVLERQHTEEAEALLQNMLKAVAVSIKQDVVDANAERLGQYSAKVVVVMGEDEAQQLLSETQTLAQLRGKVHRHQEQSVIATYSPSELLLNLADKAKAWEDLCLARVTANL